MSNDRIAVVHLVRKANDAGFLHAFIEAYRRFPAGQAHDLVFILKGFEAGEEAAVLAAAGDLRYSLLTLPDTGRDIGSYLAAARLLNQDFLFFLNSFSRPLHPGWLAKLYRGLVETPCAGVVGATGSWWRMSREHPFPNFNIRTNGFLIRRELLLQLRLWEVRDRQDAVLFEAGPKASRGNCWTVACSPSWSMQRVSPGRMSAGPSAGPSGAAIRRAFSSPTIAPTPMPLPGRVFGLGTARLLGRPTGPAAAPAGRRNGYGGSVPVSACLNDCSNDRSAGTHHAAPRRLSRSRRRPEPFPHP